MSALISFRRYVTALDYVIELCILRNRLYILHKKRSGHVQLL